MLPFVEGAAYASGVVSFLVAIVVMLIYVLPVKPFDYRRAGFRVSALVTIGFILLMLGIGIETRPSSPPLFIVFGVGGAIVIAAANYTLMFAFSRGFARMQAARQEKERKRSADRNTERRTAEQ
jgi:hypothetical protein